MQITYAFDVYGTLIDPMGIADRLAEELGEEAAEVAARWREKQLEYLFRRALMGRYEDFSVCTAQALDYSLAHCKRQLDGNARQQLLDAYQHLPAYAGAADTLASLRAKGHRVFAFSNGLPTDLDELMQQAELGDLLDGIVSVHAIRTYKPDPAAYGHFVASTGSDPESTWLVSGNPFDIIGAAACGWNTAWVRRNPKQVFDTWGIAPTRIAAQLADLA